MFSKINQSLDKRQITHRKFNKIIYNKDYLTKKNYTYK